MPHTLLCMKSCPSILSTKMSGYKEVPILRANESWIFDTGWLEGELFGLLLWTHALFQHNCVHKFHVLIQVWCRLPHLCLLHEFFSCMWRRANRDRYLGLWYSWKLGLRREVGGLVYCFWSDTIQCRDSRWWCVSNSINTRVQGSLHTLFFLWHQPF